MIERRPAFRRNGHRPSAHYKRMTIGELLREFEELAEKDQPFHPDYPIVRFKPDD